MYVSSRLILTEKNIEATEEYLNKAQVFHHLWQPDEEISDIQKAILMHQSAKQQKQAADEKRKELKRRVAQSLARKRDKDKQKY